MERPLEGANFTRVQEFILLGLTSGQGPRATLFMVFLALYLLTLLENVLIVYLICSHSELHRPMYFFLGNLSCLEISYVSVTVPSLLVGLWTGPYRVPFTACMTQLFFFASFIGTKCSLLASMAYDRYVAICRPLHYPLLLRPRVCLGLALGSWLSGLLVSVAKTSCIATLSYCGPNVLNHFFCDVSPLLNLSCTHVALMELVDFISAIVIFCGTLTIALGSYAAISRTVLQMPSAAARRKAFSTCASHLVVVGIFYSATIFIYARPRRIDTADLNKELSVIYTVLTPMCSPVIYCLRNKDVRAALHQSLHVKGDQEGQWGKVGASRAFKSVFGSIPWFIQQGRGADQGWLVNQIGVSLLRLPSCPILLSSCSQLSFSFCFPKRTPQSPHLASSARGTLDPWRLKAPGKDVRVSGEASGTCALEGNTPPSLLLQPVPSGGAA
ncbi:olfactory receptor 5-like [Suncus etruscus]|uniref:olfactory receptor 5-like n=1 Tax=Suncus etruscus TaxID=109475 RepID=UPI00210FCFC2|nr:olfactory receptor 5-like [Suncus etruscus]